MTTQNYLMINESTNVVDNICLWDGNLDTWQPPANTLMLVQATTPAKVWVWDYEIKDFVLQEQIGSGQIGFTWDGVMCITNQSKPLPPDPPENQPATQGTQTL